jgi:hypothetical protein
MRVINNKRPLKPPALCGCLETFPLERIIEAWPHVRKGWLVVRSQQSEPNRLFLHENIHIDVYITLIYYETTGFKWLSENFYTRGEHRSLNSLVREVGLVVRSQESEQNRLLFCMETREHTYCCVYDTYLLWLKGKHFIFVFKFTKF